MFLRTDQFTSSVRIKTLLEYLLCFSRPNLLFRSTCVPRVAEGISDALFTSLLRDVTGESPCVIGGLGFSVGTRKMLSCSFKVVKALPEC